MATLGANVLTFADWAKRTDPDGKIPAIVELLAQTNPIVEDAAVVEGNTPTGHRTTVRKGLPSVAWRKLNYGVAKSKSTTVQVDDSCGMLESYAEVDKDLADLNGNTSEFRMSEDRAFIESMNQTLATTMFYGDTDANPERFLGLAPRYSSLSADNAENIVDAGGSGSDNTSLWLVVWSSNTCHMIFPKGKKAGLQHRDLGEVTLEDAGGGLYQGYRSHYKWDVGMSLRDWRYVVRVANVDVSDLNSYGTGSDTSANLLHLLIEAYNKVPNLGLGRAVIYCNKTVKTVLDKQVADKSNVYLTVGEWAGKPTTMFWGIPIRRCDAILDTEAAVS